MSISETSLPAPETSSDGSLRPKRGSPLLFAGLLCAALLVAVYPRLDQYAAIDDPDGVGMDSTIPSASADSFYWFRLAREYRAGVDLHGLDRLRHYPDGTPYESVPAISIAIASIANLLGIDVYRAGLLLSIVLSGLFVIPLGLFGWYSGHPAAGLLGATLASYSSAFFARSHLFRIDTDGGNLFFVWLIALGMWAIHMGSGLRRQALAAALSGFSVALFCFWYAQPGFWFVFLITFGILIVTLGGSWKHAFALLGIYVLCSNPLNLVPGIESLRVFVFDYLLAAGGALSAGDLPASTEVAVQSGSGTLVFPDVTGEIQEIERAALIESLRRLVNPPILAVIGLGGFVGFMASRWRRAIPLLPVSMLGALGFVWASRMLMYAAPLAGFGLGYLASLGARRFAGRIPVLRSSNRGEELLAYGLCLALVAATIGASAFAKRPVGSVEPGVISSLRAVAGLVPPDAVIASTWSYGYAITDVTGAATFDDGRDPNDVVQQLLARGWTSDDPGELADILEYLATAGRAELFSLATSSADHTAFMTEISDHAAQNPVEDARVYVLFFERMLDREFSAYYYKGFWDFAAQRGTYDGFETSRCRRKSESTLRCTSKSGRFEVDLETGRVNDQPLLRRVVRTRRGKVFEERLHNAEAAVTLETIEDPDSETLTALLVREPVYRSNFNQMFVLGRIDSERFSERLDRFPAARLFELHPKPAPAGSDNARRPDLPRAHGSESEPPPDPENRSQ